MIFVIAAALGLAIGIVRGVPLSEIAATRFRGLGLLVPAVGVHLLLNPIFLPADLSLRLVDPPLPGLLPLGSLLYLAAEACALGFLFVNRRIPGFALIALGLALNVVAIVANGGAMPGDPAQLERAGLLQARLAHRDSGLWTPFTVLGPDGRLTFLVDVIYVPTPLFDRSVISVGDVVIALGELAFFNMLRLPKWLLR